MTKIKIANGQGLVALLVAGLGCAATVDAADDIVAIGPLEVAESSNVTVLGRTYRVNDTTGLVEGQRVVVHGSLQPDGSVTDAWAEPIGAYSAGSDPVYEAGVVTEVNETFGRMSIGDSKVDYTAALSEPGSSAPAVGTLVSVTGTQPEIGGVILGTTTNAGNSELQVALAGTGIRAGLAIAGITGTGRQSTAGITGTGTPGITGTGRQSTAGITGTGTPGITGTGRQSTAGITGTGTPGITGTGREAIAGITGTGTPGITGTGRQAIAGITGTGNSAPGITGTGR